jgi:hypothetical protein
MATPYGSDVEVKSIGNDKEPIAMGVEEFAFFKIEMRLPPLVTTASGFPSPSMSDNLTSNGPAPEVKSTFG